MDPPPVAWTSVAAEAQDVPEEFVIATAAQAPPFMLKNTCIARLEARALGMAVASNRTDSEASGAVESRLAAWRAMSVRAALASATARWAPGVAAEASAMVHSAACQVVIGSVTPGTRAAAESVYSQALPEPSTPMAP